MFLQPTSLDLKFNQPLAEFVGCCRAVCGKVKQSLFLDIEFLELTGQPSLSFVLAGKQLVNCIVDTRPGHVDLLRSHRQRIEFTLHCGCMTRMGNRLMR